MAVPHDPVGTVRRLLGAMAAHDWSVVGECVADDVDRTGPFLDRYQGRDEYVSFLRAVMEPLPGYAMRVERVLAAGPDVVVAQLSETVQWDGAPLETPELLVFDLDGDGRVARIGVYVQTRK